MSHLEVNTDTRIEQELKDYIEKFNLDRMPTVKEMRENGYKKLEQSISANNGFTHWRKKLGINKKSNLTIISDQQISEGILEVVNHLKIDRMPTSGEVKNYYGNYIVHNWICRNGGYEYWANKLNYDIKSSETNTGKTGEEMIVDIIESKGYKCERMTTGHPFDILINDNVKIDVKVGHAYDLRGSRCHTFGINKRHASCDIYVIAALPEEGFEIERLFIIPSNKLKVVTMSVGANSKYNQYIDRWDYIDQYHDFYKSII